MSLSGLLTVLSYLVLTMFSPFCISSLSILPHLILFVCVPVCCLVNCFLLLVHHVCPGCHYYCCECSCQSMTVIILIWSTMASSGSVYLFVCFLVWYHMYSSAVIDVSLMCCLLHVIILPVIVTCMLYDQLW